MNVIDLLRDLVLFNWRFWIEDGRLKYRAPKNAVNESLLSQLRDCKSEIIYLLGNCPGKFHICPLSYGQRALWFLWKLSPQSSAYNQSLPIRIHYKVECDAWFEVCRLLVKRHPMLRTAFPKRIHEPIQQVNPTGDIDWTRLDASAWSKARLLAEMVGAHKEPFDLDKGPVVRFRWYHCSEEEHVLLITMHHIVCDGWSLEIMHRELLYLYEMLTSGADVPPWSQDYTYHDYVRWQMEMLQGPEGERLWKFWKEELSGPLPVLDLPTDRPRPSIQTYNGDSCAFTLSKNLSLELRKLAGEEGATLYVFFMTVFLVLLYRYTGQNDILIGSPSSGRSRAEFAPIVGYFVDPVVIRGRFLGEESFREFLGNIRCTARRALEHCDFPFALLVEKLQLERNPNRSPVSDVTINYLTRHAPEDNSDVMKLDVFDIPQAHGKFDLTLNVLEGKSSITGSFGYNTDLFNKETIVQVSECFTTILEGIVDNPDQNLESIPLQRVNGEILPPAMKGPRIDLEARHLVHRLFEEQVAANLDEIAVRAGGMALTYSELNERANGLALHLQKLGVEPETIVAVCTERSVEFLIAILAVLKAGGAYVPLDPGYPKDLLEYMIVHAGVAVILTQSTLHKSLPDHDAQVICMDAFFTKPGSRSKQNPEAFVGLDNLAYVMYTSGSTGKPKGVGIEHCSLSNYVVSILQDLDITERSSFAFVSTLNADLGNTAIFPSLCTCGCLHIVPEETRLDGKAFADYIRLNRIDYLKIVPSHLAALLDFSSKPVLPEKAVILGGEASSSRWVERLQSLAPNSLFFNHYGPTEATVGVLTYRVDQDDFPLRSPTLPLRKAVANTEIFLLDRHLNPVPPGIAGEMYIGGECLARGYINDPDLTRERFITYPLAGESRWRRRSAVYKTGDLARRFSNGDIEVLGREDREINLRGYRIELDQVESSLRENPYVQQCAVLTDKDGGQAEYLLAYVVPGKKAGEEALSDKRLKVHLRHHLEQRLPGYMVPSGIVLLGEMPLTPNGKVDFRALRQLGGSPAREPGLSLPRDLLELKLSQIWSEVLGVPNVGVQDDFFRLGGHSLLALRLTGRIYEQFKRRISLAALFTSPTIEKLADVLRSDPDTLDNPVLIPIQASGSKPKLFCLPGAGGNVLYFCDLARSLGPDQPFWALQALGLGENERIPVRIEENASHYVDVIRKEVQAEGPYFLIGHSFGAFTAFEMARQLLEYGEKVVFLGVLDNAAPGSTPGELYSCRSHSEWLMHIAIRIGKLYKTNLNLQNGDFAKKSYTEQIEYFIDQLISTGILPAGLNKAHFGRFIEVYKANAKAVAGYQPYALPSPVGLTLFRAGEDDPELREQAKIADPALGWNRFTARPVEIVEVPGTHLTMLSEPHVRELADRLRECIDRASI